MVKISSWETPLKVLQVMMAVYAFSVFCIIYGCAVDIPYWDEWALFFKHRMGGNVLGGWIFERHNEHLVVPTHLSLVLNYFVFGLNFRYQVLLNYLMFSAGVFFLWRLFQKLVASDFQRFCLLLCFLPLLSSLLVYVHMMAGQNCLHFLLISFFLGGYLVFLGDTPAKFLWGVFFFGISIFSYGAGLPGVVGVFGVFLFHKVLQDRKIFFKSYFWLGIVLLALPIFYVLFTHKYSEGLPLTSPFSLLFWQYFSFIVSEGFGYIKYAPKPALICLSLLFLILAQTVYELCFLSSRSKEDWFLLGISSGILFMLATIDMGRAGFGLAQGLERYALITTLIPPLCMVLLARMQTPLKKIGMACILLITLVGIHQDFSSRLFFDIKKEREQNLQWAREVLQNPYVHSGFSPTVFPMGVTEFLITAKRMRVSFTQY